MKRVLLITDSLGFPHPPVVCYGDTYMSRLEALGNLWVIGGGGDTVTSALSRVRDICSVLDTNFFDIGIIQLGIVDCAPRPIPIGVRDRISVLPKPIVKVASSMLHALRPMLLRVKSYQYVPVPTFVDRFGDLLKEVERVCHKTVIISIAPIKESVEKHSPSLSEQVAIYNDTLRRLSERNGASFIDLSWLKSDEDKYLTEDAHIKSSAHGVIWEQLKELA